MFASPPNVYAELVSEHEDTASVQKSAASAPPAPALDETAARAFLGAHGFPVGLQTTLINCLAKTPVRFFLLDDSGSMLTGDGLRVVDRGADSLENCHTRSWVKCSRWDELADMARFHIQLAHVARAPTQFRFLNNLPPQFIGDGDDAATAQLLGVLDGAPSAGTPLCRHINSVVVQIQALAPELRAAGQKAAVIIATDGEASDGDLRHALAPLKDLPASLLLRLCTDDPRVVNYWNQVDADLELNMDVIDDFRGEAAEVSKHNPWLTYGEPLHRLRESGLGILDALDERALSPDDVRRVAHMIYAPATDLPHLQLDPVAFKRAVAAAAVAPVWDPTDGVTRPWIDVHQVTTVVTAAAVPLVKERRRCCFCCFC